MSLIYGKRKLSKDISMSELRGLRAQGLTNKQIAQRLDIAVSTVYRYIGKKSFDVMNAEAQNKPNPINRIQIEYKPHEEPMAIPVTDKKPDPVVNEAPVHNALRVLDKTVVYSLGGTLCDYEVNTKSLNVEMKNGLITGIIDKESIGKFIEELKEIEKLLDE